MTDGIIQKARNDAIEVLNQIYQVDGFISLDDATTCIQAYCNDMIEKMKQKIFCEERLDRITDMDYFEMPERDLWRLLIGDNE